jgi:hypothetical protein
VRPSSSSRELCPTGRPTGCSDRSTGPVRPQGGRILAHAPPSNPDAAWDAVLDAMEEGRAPHLTAVTANPLGLWLVCSTVYIDDRRPPALSPMPATAIRPLCASTCLTSSSRP